ncbi:MAG: glycosyltransferase family 4 protein [Vicinamibacteria bacterium]
MALATVFPTQAVPTGEPVRARRVVWVNEDARLTGGAELYVRETARRLRPLGFSSVLLYSTEGRVDPAFVASFDAAFPMVELAAQIRDVAPDLVYLHRVNGWRRIEEARRGGAPVLRFFHDHRPFCLREHKYTAIGSRTCTRPIGAGCYACLGFVNRSDRFPGITLRTLRALEAELAVSRRLDGFVVGSEYMARHVADHGFDPRRTHVLPLYSPPPAVTPMVRRDENLLLSVGQLVWGKGIDVLLEAMALLPPRVRLVIAGSGRKEPTLRAIAARLRLGERARFVGSRSGPELDRLYAEARAVVFASRSPETFGLVGPEAMRLGTPVVATTVGGIGEWLDDGVTGLAVPPNDPTALAAALRRVIDEPGLAERLGRAGRARYDARFRPESHLEALATLFRRIAP